MVRDDVTAEIPALQKPPGSMLQIIRMALELDAEVPPEMLEQAGPKLKKLAELLHLCRIKNDILQIRTTRNNQPRWVTVCPQAMRPLVIEKNHTLHHSRINHTYKRIILDWFWSGMKGDIRKQIKSCEVCQAVKNSQKEPSTGRNSLYTGRPWQVVSIDLVGSLTTMPRGSKMILVYLTTLQGGKMRSQYQMGLETVANELDQKVFAYFGLPERIHTDRGDQFESGLMK